ncbi:hypothetical protein [Streptomyces sp. NPDC091371]|uniref:hypothetical protein n=1 Tax=Streptomyces sp. NPDC091371 TaxID=3155303 RepID=UPI003444D4C3
MTPQPRTPSQPEPPEQSFTDAFRRRPVRAPRGLTPGRRVWTTLGWTVAVSVPVFLLASLAGTGALDFGTAHETAAVREIPAAPQSPSPRTQPPSPSPTPQAPTKEAAAEVTPKVEPTTGQPPAVPPPPAPAPPRATPAAGRTAAPASEAPLPQAPETAAGTVARLAAKTSGRHICYRAFVEGIGWQKTVCDGATAGTEGQSKRIKALNIAVSGTKGTAANAFVYREEWKTPWSSAADGIDMYIGGTAKDYPYMLGFVINVGNGSICQNAHVRNHGWGGLACHDPRDQRPEQFIFGGTLDNALWLEAVRFTV